MSSFAYAAQPRAIASNKDRDVYRKPAFGVKGTNTATTKTNNMMHDRRVIRGSTYSLQHRQATNAPFVPGATGPYKADQAISPQYAHATIARPGTAPRPATPPPVDGRIHASIQTETYLHDLRVTTEKVETETQTLAELDVPAPRLFNPFEPIFYPRSCHKDQAVNTDAEQLFDFDLHVEPVLDVLVENALTGAMCEVLEEQEIKDMHRRDRVYAQTIQAHEAAVGRLEQHAQRIGDERAHATADRAKAKEDDLATAKAHAARAAAHNAVTEIAQYALGRLEDAGYFYDVRNREVVQDMLPALVARVCEHVGEREAVRSEVEYMLVRGIEEALVRRAKAVGDLRARVEQESYTQAVAVVAALEEREKAAERAREADADEEEAEEELGVTFGEEEDEEEVVLYDDDEEDVRAEKQAILDASHARAQQRQEAIAARLLREAERERQQVKAAEEASIRRAARVAEQAKVLRRGHLLLEAQDGERVLHERAARAYTLRDYGASAAVHNSTFFNTMRADAPHAMDSDKLRYPQPHITPTTISTHNPANTAGNGPLTAHANFTSVGSDRWAPELPGHAGTEWSAAQAVRSLRRTHVVVAELARPSEAMRGEEAVETQEATAEAGESANVYDGDEGAPLSAAVDEMVNAGYEEEVEEGDVVNGQGTYEEDDGDADGVYADDDAEY